MRRAFVAGNWKMNLNRVEALALVAGLKAEVAGESRIDVGVFPPFVYIEAVAAAVKGTKIILGAQDCWHEAKGAFTGEVSPGMLLDVGCTQVILGHSERRHVIGEPDELIAKKTKAALAAGLKVILCVGETLEERKGGKTHDVLKTQTVKGLFDLAPADLAKVVIAYEPVWAIGTGVNATAAQANEAHEFIRGLLAGKFGKAASEAMTIQYGGSVKAENAAELMAEPHVDGALVGGASLKADQFLGIVRNTIKAKGL